LSDPFENIDNEIYLEKFKNFFNKYKKIIITLIIIIFLSTIAITTYKSYKKKQTEKISEYYTKILSIVDTDPEKAQVELQKLSKFKNNSYKNLSNLLVFKLQFQNGKFEESLKSLKIIEDNINKNNTLNKLIKYYYSQVFMVQNNKESFNSYTKELLSYGGMWSLLAYELRGHLFYSNKEYQNALKNFNKIINNQQATVSIKNRAQEMIDNINLHYEKSS
jgi:hypothetical protein